MLAKYLERDLEGIDILVNLLTFQKALKLSSYFHLG